MTRPSTPPILSELRIPTSPASQLAALRALKNEIIGHEQKKEMWVGLGVVAPISRILNTHKGVGKRRYREPQDSVEGSRMSDEEEARLQAIIIIGSLATGQSNPVEITSHLSSGWLTTSYQVDLLTYHPSMLAPYFPPCSPFSVRQRLPLN
jgi:hypothetical protein